MSHVSMSRRPFGMSRQRPAGDAPDAPRRPSAGSAMHILGDNDYLAWYTKIAGECCVVDQAPIHGFRSLPERLAADLRPLLAGVTLAPREACAAPLDTADAIVAAVLRVDTLLQLWALFSKYYVCAAALDQVYALFRRLNAQFAAAVEEPTCYATVVCTSEIIAKRLVKRISVKISYRPPQLRAKVAVRCGGTTKIMRLCPEMLDDPALVYAGVVSVITNPLSPQPQAEIPPDVINIAPPMRFAHARQFVGKTPAELDNMAHAVYETPDGDARFVFDHFLRLMCAAATASDEAKTMRREDGYNLLYKLCWVVQTCERSAQVLALFSPVQQCGKTTVLDLLRAVLGDGLVRSVSAPRLGGQFNAFLRNLLFLFLDEGADALTCERLYVALKEITGCNMLQTEEKNQPSVPFNNVITAIITANRTWVALEPGNERVTPYLVSGGLQGNSAYFDRLHGALQDEAAMADLFLLFSRARLVMEDGTAFRPQYCSPLGSRMLGRMANPALARVYAGLHQVLIDCAAQPMAVGEFRAALRAIAAKVYPDSIDTVAELVSEDLFARGVLYPVHDGALVASCLRIKAGARVCEAPYARRREAAPRGAQKQPRTCA